MATAENSLSKDWDLSKDYYQETFPSEELHLADFLETSDTPQPETDNHISDKAELQRVTNLVRQVTERSGQGDTIHSIAAELGVSEQYVKDILICVQSFPEDNAEAVAHLMLD